MHCVEFDSGFIFAISLQILESLALEASPDGILWINGSVSASAHIFSLLFFACLSIASVFRLEEIQGNLITVQNCQIDVDHLSSVLLQSRPTQTINSPVRIEIQISACSSHN